MLDTRENVCAQAAPDAFQAGPDGALRQVKADEEYLHPAPLGHAYGQCVARARKKAAIRKAASFKSLPEGSGLEFTKQSRAAIDPAILARIRSV
jgi:hypothetical protein